MAKVLIVSSSDMTPELEHTILWRADIVRYKASDAEEGRRLLRAHHPDLTILRDDEPEATMAFVRELRADDATRNTSLVVIRPSATLSDEQALRQAGANVVFGGEVVPYLWDAWLEDLLSVPRRREARVPVKLEIWSHVANQEAPMHGRSVNVSVKGMLLETKNPVDIGAKLDMSFRLPGDEGDLRAVAQVVREETSPQGTLRVGVEFLILRETGRERIREFVESEARV